MSRPISLFSGYSQRENRTTNYCMLLLKMLYEENPKFLQEVMGAMVGEDLADRIGVKFRQQERKTSSIPDGLILQDAFTIYIETKNWDWFYDEQLEKHLENLDDESAGFKVLIALSNFEGPQLEKFSRIHDLCASKYQKSIVFRAVSFEEFVTSLQLDHLPKNLADAISEFRAYLDEQNFLPQWERWLDVINCAGIPDDVLVGGAYLCPATGGAYSHYRCKYFGMYRNRRVDHVAMIEAVVDVEGPGDSTIRWNNLNGDKRDLKKLAEAKIKQLRPGNFPTRVFLLGPLYATDCYKETSGGMVNSKQYWDISHLKATDAESLAHAMLGKTWSEIRVPG